MLLAITGTRGSCLNSMHRLGGGWKERALFNAIISGKCTYVIPNPKKKKRMSCPLFWDF